MADVLPMTGAELEKLINWTLRPCYWHPTGAGLDASGLDRSAKRRAAIEMQGGTCAACPSTVNLCGDHDHVSGLFRGILCRSCNSSWNFTRTDLLPAYMSNPPLAHLEWQWDLPQETGPFVWISTGTPRGRAIIRCLSAENMWALARTLVAMDLPLPDVRFNRETPAWRASAAA